MKFEPTELAGVYVVRAAPAVDERGFFARIYCPEEFARAGIGFASTQINLSRNDRALTLRGMHYQDRPQAESKLVRVTRGRIHDVAVDIRPASPTFGRSVAVQLDADNADAFFLPEGVAHGFLTLEDDTDVLYQMGRAYMPGFARGFRFDDPAFSIAWPAAPSLVSERDLAYAPFASSRG